MHSHNHPRQGCSQQPCNSKLVHVRGKFQCIWAVLRSNGAVQSLWRCLSCRAVCTVSCQCIIWDMYMLRAKMQNSRGETCSFQANIPFFFDLPILAIMDTNPESTHSEPADYYKAKQARKAILAEYHGNIQKLIKDGHRCASLLCMPCSP